MINYGLRYPVAINGRIDRKKQLGKMTEEKLQKSNKILDEIFIMK